jgi:hypothetical protein
MNNEVGISYFDLGEYMRAFIEHPENRKTPIYYLCNKTDERISLGEIKWNGRWRKYCYYPVEDTVFDAKCLQEIINFLEHLREERKQKL